MHLSANLLFAVAASAGHVSFNLRKGGGGDDGGTAKRDAVDVDTFIDRVGHGLYFVDLQIGTPPQDINLALDTGSSDLLVKSGDSSSEAGKRAVEERPFFPQDSNTYENVSGSAGFESAFLDGSKAFGTWFKDTVIAGSKKIEAQQMGLNHGDTAYASLLGLGFPSGEAIEGERYPTLVENMANEGIIERKAFSLYLAGDTEETDGTILFGGIDTNKFSGELKSVNLIDFQAFFNASKAFQAWSIPLTGMSVSDESGNSKPVTDKQAPSGSSAMTRSASLDCGSTLSILPAHLVKEAGKDFEVVLYSVPHSTREVALIDCKYMTSKYAKRRNVTFRFGEDALVHVSVQQLVLDVGNDGILETAGPYGDDEDRPFPLDDTCLFGLQSMPVPGVARPENEAVIGHNILRSAYVVFDVDNLAVGIAQANHQSTEERIVDIQANETEVPRLNGTISPKSEDINGNDNAHNNGGSDSGGNGGKTGGDDSDNSESSDNEEENDANHGYLLPWWSNLPIVGVFSFLVLI